MAPLRHTFSKNFKGWSVSFQTVLRWILYIITMPRNKQKQIKKIGLRANQRKRKIVDILYSCFDIFIRSTLLKSTSQVHNWDIRGWDTECHSSKLSIEFWKNFSNSLHVHNDLEYPLPLSTSFPPTFDIVIQFLYYTPKWSKWFGSGNFFTESTRRELQKWLLQQSRNGIILGQH